MEYNFVHHEYDKADRKGGPKRLDVLIGCPIQKRDWIISEWHWKVMAACKKADMRPGFIFVLDPTEEPLNTMIHNLCKINGVDLWTCEIDEVNRTDIRDWTHERFNRMVDLRNILLDGVRQVKPPLFLSLDSDILLHPDSLSSLRDNLEAHPESAAIGGKAYLTHTGCDYPSYGIFKTSGGSYRRQEAWGCFKVDILMAIKLMRPAAYNVDYRFADQGEDIGFSKACKEAGLKFMWDGSIANKHVMRRQDLDRVDPRCGY